MVGHGVVIDYDLVNIPFILKIYVWLSKYMA